MGESTVAIVDYTCLIRGRGARCKRESEISADAPEGARNLARFPSRPALTRFAVFSPSRRIHYIPWRNLPLCSQLQYRRVPADRESF